MIGARGVKQAVLSVLAANIRAIALYERLGSRDSWSVVSKTNGQTYRRLVKAM